nr:hypothetical protein [Frankia sp. CiP3]
MSALVTPTDAVAAVRSKIDQKWAEAVCADLGVGGQVVFSVPLRPGVSTGKAVERLGYAAWHEWHMRWREFSEQLPTGVELVRKAATRSLGVLPDGTYVGSTAAVAAGG